MQTRPTGWPADNAVETIPEFQIVTDSPAVPGGVTPVSTYQIRRDLTGGGLPGGARGGSGFSVADGTVTVPQQGTHVTPWSASPVLPGAPATLQAVHGDATLPLGQFIVEDVSGADSDGEVTLGLIEETRRLDGEVTDLPTSRGHDYWPDIDHSADLAPVDMTAAIVSIAEKSGFITSMAPSLPASCDLLVGAPLQGNPAPSTGVSVDILTAKFGTYDGRIGLVGGSVKMAAIPYFNEDDVESYTSCTLHVETGGSGCSVAADIGMLLVIGQANSTLTVNPGKGYGGVFIIPPTHRGDKYTFHLSIGISRMTIYVCTPANPQWVQLGTITARFPNFFNNTLKVSAAPGISDSDRSGWVSSVYAWYSNLTTPPAVTYPAAITARLEASGSSGVLIGDSNQSGREVIQDIARATMGAAWMDETGTLVYRNAEHMRTRTPVETVVSDRQLEDLPWQISREDTADRIEYTYTPATLERDFTSSLTIWEATEKTRVPAGKTITITADLENRTTDHIADFLPIWDTTTAGTDGKRMSRWAAATSSNGDGTRPDDNAIQVSATVSGTKAAISVTNTTSKALWLVDGNGEPCLILRSQLKVSSGEQQALEWGLPKEQALNTFSFDAGQWVQDAETAQEQLNWLASQMQQAQATIPQVNVKPNLARQLGDIVLLKENQLTPDHKPLKTKALITGSDLDGDANGYTTTLNLALLAVTYGDVNEWAVAQSVTTFAQLDTKLTSLGLTTFNQLDQWLAAGNTL